MYNRRLAALANFDNTNSWNYTTATYRVKNNSALNEISMVTAFAGDGVFGTTTGQMSNPSPNVTTSIAIGFNSTTTVAAGCATAEIRSEFAGSGESGTATYSGMAALGFNFYAPLEQSAATGTTTWIGDAGGTTF